MKFVEPLLEGRLIRRYKRFLADVELLDGRKVTAHTSNTGAMTGCCDPGSRIWLSVSANPKRKYAYTWELVEVDAEEQKSLVGINTLLANQLVAEAINHGTVQALAHYTSIRKEVRYGEENSRIDLLLSADEGGGGHACYVEVKNVTLAQAGVGYFPDAKSARAVKHLRELTQVKARGAQAVIFFCVPREDVSQVRPAGFIDSVYTEALRSAVANGVQALAYKAKVSTREILLQNPLPVILD
ncbi:MAG: transcriptional regulator [Gammaproteobacteria bacterium SG8_11]|nr:MAG: transcriptional regulator [Gammaproteobacteria bacterium SG8_11]